MDFSEHGKLREFCATAGKTDFVLWVQPVASNPWKTAVERELDGA